MKTKSSRQNKGKVIRSHRRAVARKPIRKHKAARGGKTFRKPAVNPKEVESTAGVPATLPAIPGAEGEGIRDVVEIIEIRVLNPEGESFNAAESSEPEEAECEILYWSEG